MKKRKKRRILSWYRDLSITKKIYIPNFLIIILLIVVSVYTANKVFSVRMVDQVKETTGQSLDIIIQSMDSVLNNIGEAAEIVSRNETVQSVLKKLDERDEQQEEDHYFLIRSVLQEIVYLRNAINGVTVYTKEGIRVGSQSISGKSFSTSSVLNQDLVKMAISQPGQNIWIDPEDLSYSGENKGIVGPILLRGIKKQSSGSVVGILQISVSESIFSSLYSHLDYGPTGRFVVLDSRGTLKFPERSYQTSFLDTLYRAFVDWKHGDFITENTYNTSEGSTLIMLKELSKMGWAVLAVVPLDDFLAISRSFSPLLYLIGALFIILELLFAAFVTRTISKPIVNLSDSMRKVGKGDYSLRLARDSHDEIGDLVDSFNHMLVETSSLMEQIYQQNKRERELELLALQSQIKPHFLYNSLETIASLIQLEQQEQAFELIKAVSLFFKGVLSKGKPIITIAEEIETIRYYMAIQQTRYPNKLTYAIDIDEELLKQPIVKLTLQPLVENSIYHGLKAIHDKGMVRISGWRENDVVRLRVFDNGAGISPEKMNELVDENGNIMTESGGFGISSVDQRIKQYFGNQYGVTISSRHNFWTQVLVTIPY
ncbi:MAG: sensor histidine kinase [Sphaerochaetaceae bacterium]|nr:sensor histidine kinase [Sphaerochaetaceae bacterium]